jgi:hypothetical protein
MNPDKIDSVIKLLITITFCMTICCMVFLSMYSLVFVPQPMNAIAPADKQFFFLLSDMSKYILGSLGTLLAIKGKDAVKDLLAKPADPEPPKSEETKESK